MQKLQRSTEHLIKMALIEDIGEGDITTKATVPKEKYVEARMTAKEEGIIVGLDIAREVFRQIDRRIRVTSRVREGARVKKGAVIATLKGPARGILTGERAALNFIQHLSGIATLTGEYRARIKGTKARLLDTRKTIPGWRSLEKQAVKLGGGENHRFGLYDAILIKDNHLKIAKTIEKAVDAARIFYGKRKVEVEAGSLTEVRGAIEAGADRILLDNMGLAELKKSVALCKQARIETEASGGIGLRNIRGIAKTGVDYISVGALTHSAKALDVNLKID
ncbi:nicotinate-nucleotide diphosphorylase (carboxylating) [candidate division WOR-1 bacterium RIFOXYA12_FULL_52_29]|uniref:Probable nicotinate-nucleotide pyrophosphorylase [carboxylating] n=1 Tax=candidate division WOR-1 bacterium RIFOXYC12_FULL_54_18 TaxID=1802584 RepID=A0A1F4T770_UNCSA|nr:MAG: nicotinate-nucleotide diphosphorylase (carboxylating) [candidate division WOR-1 bacterium RIFOXYA2_FULL_51_19]OGC17990.1 MAG: nicotinate-nucleotide diphosphorylase (carboxylating) [candidate division WOR-1 bacterium RIFOXYA12_FULL_52_29]OGC26846.1 MAG: nicotinate-nucleotide diphosphorylase (carboxylating) [candidate division WOR-1 bacterium RIFOXYB2_FULL_45_9]OGC28407.1 MAG: nicotinate-nucleotide diphosphorylase (carboxylating) [candidate division WOR-1 bacterium RIFOXYC12_FULL_54_18]OG